jgi:hypothetical protein
MQWSARTYVRRRQRGPSLKFAATLQPALAAALEVEQSLNRYFLVALIVEGA